MKFRLGTEQWNRFFHEPRSTAALGLYRIVFGLLCLLFGATIHGNLMLWYTQKGPVPAEVTRAISGGRFPVLGYLPDSAIPIFFWAWMAAAALMTIGLWTRRSTVAAVLGLIALHHRNTLILHSGDSFLRCAGVFLMFAPAGRSFSIDRLIRVARGQEDGSPPRAALWTQRMIALQLTVLYAATVSWKLLGEKWLDGTALYYTSRLEEFRRFDIFFGLNDSPWFFKGMTWATLVVEAALGSLVWWRPARKWVLLAGIALHAGIDLSMNIPLFSWITVTAYLTFLDGENIEALLARWRARREDVAELLYDGACAFCTRTVTLLSAADFTGAMRYADFRDPETLRRHKALDPEMCDREIQLVEYGGRIYSGFHAFRWMATRLPLAWPLVPLLYLPGMAWAGERVYRRVAEKRGALLFGRCTAENCAIPQRVAG